MTRSKANQPSHHTPTARQLVQWDHQYLWHPFTQMKEWVQEQPIIIEKAKGVYLYDIHGKRYLDGTSSIWVNLHGHRHPALDQAIRNQLKKVAHTTLLGLSSPPAIRLAKELVRLAPKGLTRVFYSDDGSTAVEVALKMAIQYWQQQDSLSRKKTKFVRLDLAYHGDTAGAMSVGGIHLFHDRFRPLLVDSIPIEPPYCYRCPLGLSYPDCRVACVDQLDKVLATHHEDIAGVIFEPKVQAVAGMVTQPPGYVSRVRELCTKYGVLMIADEVATGFGRTGKMFACQHEGVTPDLLCVAKGLTGGYLPLAATLTTEKVYEAFLGDYAQFKTFFHGHSFTGNPLGAAVALANLEVFQQEQTLAIVKKHTALLHKLLKPLKALPIVGEVRQCGMMVGIELVADTDTRQPFPLTKRMGHQIARVCQEEGLLIRPIGNILILMPPLNTPAKELRLMVKIVFDACRRVSSNT